MNYIKAFMAGITLPSILLPIILCSAVALGKTQVLTIPFLHFIPLLWGVWNVLYLAFFQKIPLDSSLRWLITGALLGFLIAIYGVFGLHLPEQIGLPKSVNYVPVLFGPILYALLWRFIVKPLNELLGIA